VCPNGIEVADSLASCVIDEPALEADAPEQHADHLELRTKAARTSEAYVHDELVAKEYCTYSGRPELAFHCPLSEFMADIAVGLPAGTYPIDVVLRPSCGASK
jgi:hypothetical protein